MWQFNSFNHSATARTSTSTSRSGYVLRQYGVSGPGLQTIFGSQSAGDSFEVCRLLTYSGSCGRCWRSSHATFSVPAMIFCSMDILAAFLLSFREREREGQSSSCSISSTLDVCLCRFSANFAALLYLLNFADILLLVWIPHGTSSSILKDRMHKGLVCLRFDICCANVGVSPQEP